MTLQSPDDVRLVANQAPLLAGHNVVGSDLALGEAVLDRKSVV